MASGKREQILDIHEDHEGIPKSYFCFVSFVDIFLLDNSLPKKAPSSNQRWFTTMTLRTLLRSKIHRATVTEADLHYEGSISIDADLMQAANIAEFEQVQVADVENGARLETYVMKGPAGTGMIRMNGAAARLVGVGDHIIIMAYAQVEDPPPPGWKPAIVLVDAANKIREANHAPLH
jgi:aspartate 1-decarboxylase